MPPLPWPVQQFSRACSAELTIDNTIKTVFLNDGRQLYVELNYKDEVCAQLTLTLPKKPKSVETRCRHVWTNLC